MGDEIIAFLAQVEIRQKNLFEK
jgi:adenine-specific DNA-methyltransferase